VLHQIFFGLFQERKFCIVSGVESGHFVHIFIKFLVFC